VACKFLDSKYCAFNPQESWEIIEYSGNTRNSRREQRRWKDPEERGRWENRWENRRAYIFPKRARRRTLAYFLVIHSIACLDNASAGRQQYFMVSHLACPELFLSTPISPRLHLTLRSSAHVCANVTSASAIGDAIRRFYCYYVVS